MKPERGSFFVPVYTNAARASFFLLDLAEELTEISMAEYGVEGNRPSDPSAVRPTLKMEILNL